MLEITVLKEFCSIVLAAAPLLLATRSREPVLLSGGVLREVLANGTTVLLKRTTASPVVAITAYFKVGYFHEVDEESGLAHLMEHMFFKGSRSLPGPEDVGRAVNGLGGSLNAGTIYDRTFYYFVLPRESMEPAIRIMSDAVIRPILDADEMRKEIEVIIEESNRKRDNPGAMAFELMLEQAYDVHRIRRWRIGSDKVLRSLNREQALDFHERLYRPAHLVVSVVGDIDLERARSLVVEAFSELPTGVPVRTGSPPEPLRRGLTVAHRKAAIQQAFLELGFQGPGVGHPDQEALELLAEILGGGRSSRLYRTVKAASGLVRTISASAFAFEDVGMLRVSATLEPRDLSSARQRLLEELERVRQWGVFPQELMIARNRLEAQRLFQLEEVRSQAVTLAYHEAYGDYREVDRSLARLKAITGADLKRVARQYLAEELATVFSYLPETAEVQPDELEVVRAEWERARASAAHRPAKPEPVSLPRRRRLPSPIATGRPSRLSALPGGGTLLVLEDSQLPTAAIGVYFPGGRRLESPRQAGLNRLALRAARTGGTVHRSPDAQLAAVEALGASLSPELNEEFLGYRLHLASARSGDGLELLTDVMTEPTFHAERLDRERESIIADIRQAHDQPGRTAVDLFCRAFFGEEHPLGAPGAGSEAVVSGVSREEVVRWHTRSVVGGGHLVVAAGNLRAEALEVAIGERLAVLPEREGAPAWGARTPFSGIREQIELRDKQQSALAMGFAAPPPSHPDYPALLVLLDVLSCFGGRLQAELRGRQSLAYSVSASEMGLATDNAVVCFIAGEASKEAAAREGMLRELKLLRDEPVTAEELARAKAGLIGRRATGLQTLGTRVARYAWAQLKGLGIEGFLTLPERISRVSVEDVKRVAETWLTLDHYAIGIARGRGKQ